MVMVVVVVVVSTVVINDRWIDLLLEELLDALCSCVHSVESSIHSTQIGLSVLSNRILVCLHIQCNLNGCAVCLGRLELRHLSTHVERTNQCKNNQDHGTHGTI